MPIINSNVPINLFSPVATPVVRTAGPPMLDLSVAQLVRATVVDVGVEQSVLEINRQNYLAQGERELQVGQKLQLQVVQTQPKLEFRVLNNVVNDRLGSALPTLTRPFDWSQLIGQLQTQVKLGNLPSATQNIYTQLQQVLMPNTSLPSNVNSNISQIVAQLQQLNVANNLNTDKSISLPLQMPLQSSSAIAATEVSPVIGQLVKNLQQQLAQLPKQGGVQLPQNWYADTRNALAPLQSGRIMPQPGGQQYQLLLAVLSQLQRSPAVSPQLGAEVDRILTQMTRGIVQDLGQQENLIVATKVDGQTTSSATVKSTVVASQQNISPGGNSAVVNQEARGQLTSDIKHLLEQVQSKGEQGQKVGPELLGKLEGLLSQLQKFVPSPGQTQVLIPEFATLVTQLSQLVDQQPTLPQGKQLGVLSQLFGFHLEAELLSGKKKAALASLKLSLLNLQKDLGAEVEEPLRRIELLQLCKAKLAEEQVQFVPLPFNELEEGYLLAEKQNHDDTDSEKGGAPLQMSLSLRLSALGNVRIDMLYEDGGLQLRLASEDREKMAYLQGCSNELKESLQAVKLQGVSFSADAKLPAQQLQQRLLPASVNILDERA